MNLEIGRLVLDLPGLAPDEGRRLAESLAERLGVALRQPLGGANAAIGRIEVVAPVGADPETLSRAIATALRQRIG